MKTKLLILAFVLGAFSLSYSQSSKSWTTVKSKSSIIKNDYVQRENFPESYELIQLNTVNFNEILVNVLDRFAKNAKPTIVSLPNASGQLERFEIFEASNFVPELQLQFPQIRSYAGNGIDDKTARLRMSVDPRGVYTMIQRADKGSEFMEPYSKDGLIHAVYTSSNSSAKLPFTCSTSDKVIENDLLAKANSVSKSSAGKLLNFRLAMSVTPEYTAYHGGTKALALAAINTTMTRVNGVFETDFAIHMNLINNLTIIYDGTVADPYGATSGNYNLELQQTLTSVVGNANYDVGHLMGRVGNNGNAGCIGCVCVNPSTGDPTAKGSGFTTSTVPVGDNFDIDFVAHEMGHQFGANHTFSHGNEGSGVNMEVGSGVTIMGYAGITGQDTHAHSVDVFHAGSIAQVQANMVSKTCQTVVNITHSAPVVNAGDDYIIPKSTPFVLTGSATDVGGAGGLTYTWEQYDNDSASQTGAASAASATKVVGPNWVNYVDSSLPVRHFPIINTTIANSQTTAGLDVTAEALSSVARVLNFRLTARDNVAGLGQTNFDNARVTVNGVAGPFVVTSPNTNLSWVAGSNQTVTWNVAGTTENGVNASFVDVYLSTDGGFTYPVLLASKVPNDGSELVTVPNLPGSTNRVMVRGYRHVFYDISNANFTITAPPSTFSVSFSGVADTQNFSDCTFTNVSYNINYATFGGFNGATTFSVIGNPAGSTVSFSPSSVSANQTVVMTLGNLATVGGGAYQMMVNATSSGVTKSVPFYLYVGLSQVDLISPINNSTSQNTTLSLNWDVVVNSTSYDVQIATDNAFTNIVSTVNVSGNSYNASGLNQATEYFWRVLPKNATCTGNYGSAYKFTTGTISCTSTVSINVPIVISDVGAPTINSTTNVSGSGSVSDVNVTMNVSHSYLSDLTAVLVSPTGVEVVLFQSKCSSQDNVNATFDDAGVTAVCSGNPALTGTIKATGSLSDFNGINPAGAWMLRISDAYNEDGGSLNSWSLNICTLQALSSESFESIKNLVIYPNPNTGSFDVKFASNSENEVKIGVHDIRGRRVFDKTFGNSSLFNENIQLGNVQAGMYIVVIEDGINKKVEKIIVQ